MKKFTVGSFFSRIEYNYSCGNPYAQFDHVCHPDQAASGSLIWIRPDIDFDINKSKASVIIAHIDSIGKQIIRLGFSFSQCLIVTDKPKLAFIRIVDLCFSPGRPAGIHPLADIHKDAKIHNTAFIGAFTTIGRATIGAGSYIDSHCRIHDSVNIGNQVNISSGCVIGGNGFGYEKNSSGQYEHFPHLGGVVIGHHVDVGANTCIDKGSIGNTIIKSGAKIDNLVHIAHNVTIGHNTAVIAAAMIGGSVYIGDNTWIAPGAKILNQIKIGDNVTVGMGAVVTKNIPSGETWAGSPAMPTAKLKEIQNKLRDL